MVPDIAGNGASFRGAGAYYFHDAPHQGADGQVLYPTTSARVGAIALRNLVAATHAEAIDEMWHTADNQTQLKREAGVPVSGRVVTKPVKTLSLAWHPDQTPTTEHMIEAADSYLQHMGWQEHQAIYVQHTDKPHAHIHIILNRVHPTTGRTLDDFRERIRSQVWALAYEREHGQILCQERLSKDYAAEAIPKRDLTVPNSIEKESRAQEAPFLDLTNAIAKLDGTERDLLSRRQQEEREAFFASAPDDFRAARQAAFVAVRQEFKPQWRAHFEQEKNLMAQARELAGMNATQAFDLAHAGRFGEAWATIAGRNGADDFNPMTLAKATVATAKAKIAEAMREVRIERQQQACQQTFDARADAYKAMKERQRDERAELRQMIAKADKGEAIDANRLAQLTHGPRAAAPTSAQDAIAMARAANQNADPIDRKPSSNDNRPPQVQAKVENVARANHHIDLLLASARMTASGSMVSMQMADIKMLARRAEREARQHEKTRPPPEPHGQKLDKETSERMQRLFALDTRSEEEKARDAQEAARRGRDRGGGRER